MLAGTVKWFNTKLGFGFVVPKDEDKEIFVHFSEINMNGYRRLKAGQTVTFETHIGKQGLRAINVTLSNDPTSATD